MLYAIRDKAGREVMCQEGLLTGHMWFNGYLKPEGNAGDTKWQFIPDGEPGLVEYCWVWESREAAEHCLQALESKMLPRFHGTHEIVEI